MLQFFDSLVDLTLEDDSTVIKKSNNNTDEIKTYKDLDMALQHLDNKGKIFIYPGIYAGSNIFSRREIFTYHLEGSGKKVELGTVENKGYVDFTIKNLKIREVTMNTSDSTFNFENIDFIGGHKMILKGHNDTLGNPSNSIEFFGCTFGINFQIEQISGVYDITFKNCKILTKVFPFILTKGGESNIKLALCNFDTPVVNNSGSTVYIYYSSCNFSNEIWTGKECGLFSKDSVIDTLELNKYDIKKETHFPQIVDTEEYSAAISINTTELGEIELELKSNTTFIHVEGNNPLSIILPNVANIKNGHKIEILKSQTCPFVIINDDEYHNTLINVWFVKSKGWLFGG